MSAPYRWRDTPDGAELVVDGVVRARAGFDHRGLWFYETRGRCGGELSIGSTGFVQVADAQRAAERALGLAGAVNDFDPELPRWQGPAWECQMPGCGLRWGEDIIACPVHHGPGRLVPNDSESPKGSPWSCSCGASGVAPDPGPESCPKCGAGEDGDATNPSHYQQHPAGIECIAVTEAFNFNVGNAIKYLWRAGLKGDRVTDLRKSLWYIEREIERCSRA